MAKAHDRSRIADSPEADRVLAAIDQDRQDLIDLCLRLGNLRDYSGQERAVGEAVVAWFGDAGIEARLQRITAESVNAIAVLRGSGDRDGGGRSLILNAHMDTQGGIPDGGDAAERRIRGAWVDGELIHGRGLANDKAQLAAEMIAARAIQHAGVRLKGDLIVAGVAQETGAPIDDAGQWASWSGAGPEVSQSREGFGSRWLITHGVVADYALVAEISDFTVTVAQAGYLRLRIAVPGNVKYTPRLARGPGLAANPNPFERAAHVIVALEAWARTYEQDDGQAFWGGRFVPRAQVYEVRPSGPPFTEPRDACLIFLDVRLVPGANPAAIQSRVEHVVRALDLGCAVTPYDYRRGFVADGAEPLLDAVRDAHLHVLGDALPFADATEVSMWRDSNSFNEAGIPAIGYGPPARDPPTGGDLAGAERPIAVADLMATAKVFALTALSVCGVEGGMKP